MTKEDSVIICGDFGSVWSKDDESMTETISHCASTSTAALLSHGAYKSDYLTQYLEEIRQKVTFKK